MQTQIPSPVQALSEFATAKDRVLTTKIFWDDHIQSLHLEIFHFSQKGKITQDIKPNTVISH